MAKTGRLVVADEDYHSYGVSGEVIASVIEHDASIFRAPPQRVCIPDVSIPFSRPLENSILPLTNRITDAALKTMKSKS